MLGASPTEATRGFPRQSAECQRPRNERHGRVNTGASEQADLVGARGFERHSYYSSIDILLEACGFSRLVSLS